MGRQMKKTMKKRRREHKTDYLKRLTLLKSTRPRVVVRKTNTYLIAQYVVSKEAQDTITFGISSKTLLTHGWPKTRKGSLNSLPAAYLLGLLFGKKIKNKKLAIPIIDFGMHRVIHGSKLQAFIKGLVDSELQLHAKEESFPTEERIEGKHLKELIPFNEIKAHIEKHDQ